MRIDHIRNRAGREEIDYITLKSYLSSYANPRDKISRFLRSGDLIRVKKGLYVFGPQAAREPYSVETLANQIYGPSALSLEYALSRYGMIPERVYTVTSVTCSRNKLFKTPVGTFSYSYQNPEVYSEGIALVSIDPAHSVLMAMREKALADYLTINRSCPTFESETDLYIYLRESMRIDEHELMKLSPQKIRRIEKVCGKRNVMLLRKVAETIRKGDHE